MICELYDYPISGEYEGVVEYEPVKCARRASVKLYGLWVCWDHAQTEYGFDMQALL